MTLKTSPSIIGPTIGFPRDATVKNIDFRSGTMQITINLSASDYSPDGQTSDISIPIPASWAGPDGQWAGGFPTIGGTIRVVLGQGGVWTPLPYIPNDGVFGNSQTTRLNGFSENVMGALRPGRYLIQTENNIRLIADPKTGLTTGNPIQFQQADPTLGILSNTFDNNLEFTEAHRSITGPVARDQAANSTRNVTGSALTSHIYQKSLRQIGLDPRTISGIGIFRNPAFAESRQIVYEFNNSFGFTNDVEEQGIYDGTVTQNIPDFFPRRESRADALSLSLIEPNQLIEKIEGTIVDIYGNILDLNRSILPNGSITALSFRNNEQESSQTFVNLREQTRKSIAYHFEINARKATSPDLENLSGFVDSTADYARERSKFFFDVDKEGQFKLNVPMSSEVGNIGLLTRYENYSTLIGAQEGTDPRAFVRNNTNQDIFLDSHGVGFVDLSASDDGAAEAKKAEEEAAAKKAEEEAAAKKKAEEEEAAKKDLAGFAAPTDRLQKDAQGRGIPIKLGTAFHDINQTLQLFGNDRNPPIPKFPDSKINNVPPVTEIVTNNIIVSGVDANAGGRSGTISLDGMLNLNIGANTVDRQSLWIDMAGGIVSNVGRDLLGRSYMGRFDGDILVQVGGATVGSDSRFSSNFNGNRDGTIDIRVVTNADMHIIRIDSSGLRVYTPGEIDIVSDGNMRFKSRRNNITFDAESIFFYANENTTGRLVRRNGIEI